MTVPRKNRQRELVIRSYDCRSFFCNPGYDRDTSISLPFSAISNIDRRPSMLGFRMRPMNKTQSSQSEYTISAIDNAGVNTRAAIKVKLEAKSSSD